MMNVTYKIISKLKMNSSIDSLKNDVMNILYLLIYQMSQLVQVNIHLF